MTTAGLSADTGEAVLGPDLRPVAVVGQRVTGQAVVSGGLDRRRRAVLVVAPLVASLLAAGVTALVVASPAALAGPMIGCWVLALPGVWEGVRRLDRGDLDLVLRRTVATFAVTALALAVTGGSTALLVDGALILAAAAAALVLVVVAASRLAPARVLLVGEPHAVAATLRRWPAGSGAEVVGAVLAGSVSGDPEDGAVLASLPCTGDSSSVRALVRQWRVDCVAVAPTASFGRVEVARLAWQLESTRARLLVCAPALDAVGRGRVALGRLADTTFVRLAASRVPPVAALGKAVLDRLLAVLALVLLAPLLVVLGLLIRWDSPGPAVFRQTRVGRDGTPFTMFKLRTMGVHAELERALLVEADQGNGVLFKLHDDPRVTRVGRVLRRLSLDELPQLANVALGEMSLVGPRPALPSEAAGYDDVARRRLVVRPGITGLWQVRGRSDLDWERSVALDVQYADNVTLRGDLLICLATARAVLSRRGAY